LVELMIALLFALLLMAGLGMVFKASLSSFYTSGESLSNARRSRMSIDLLGDDINLACMYLADIALPPQTLANVPPFFVIPNVPIANAGAGDPKITDELYFYLDEPLPFEGTLQTASTQTTAADLVMSGGDIDTQSSAYIVNCLSHEYAKQVEDGQVAILKDFWEAVYVTSLKVNGQIVTFAPGASPSTGVVGGGPSGLPARANHVAGAAVMFVRPAQMVRYRIVMLRLDPDPERPSGVPCLVRDQGQYTWDGSGFNNDDESGIGKAPRRRQIITENVSGFKTYLSVNDGRDWAGLGLGETGFASGWDGLDGIRGQLDKQLWVAGRLGFQTTRGREHWFREIPTLVRIDLTTRTATRRTEFSKDRKELAHKELTQSLVFVPKHFGLSMN
jgi:hypothetical protein